MFDAELLRIIACPWCVAQGKKSGDPAKGTLNLVGEPQNPTALKCASCARVYQIHNSLPNMLISEAEVHT
ncbi:MAG TPA: hypothetical protein VGP72_28490 [Planctomycetota bacterium]|jgi:uncharacterized protein YbaR (Trm112 family)